MAEIPVVGAEIRSWGSRAERFAGLHAIATVAGAFARSVHLEADGDVMCVGDASIGNGPLNATVDPQSWQRAWQELPSAGHRARLSAGTIELGGVAFRTGAAQHWHPPAWPPMGREGPLNSLERLLRRAQSQIPAEGLAPIALDQGSAALTAIQRAAQPRVERFRRWMRARLSHAPCEPAPVDLLGLGPGLTPSGDDLLCGALLALDAVARADVANDLAAAILRAGPTSTSLLSRAFLEAAAEGQGPEPLHRLIIALLEDGETDRHLATLSRFGHTSGWDALSGAAIVLRALSAR